MVGHSLERVRTPVLESQARPGDQVNDRSRDKHLARLRLVYDARREVHREPADIAAKELQLAGVEAAANLEIQASNGLRDRARTLNRARRSIERGQRPVASPLDQLPAEPFDLTMKEVVEVVEHVMPTSVAHFGSASRRADDVGKQHRCEDSIGLAGRTNAGQELLHLIEEAVGVPEKIVM